MKNGELSNNGASFRDDIWGTVKNTWADELSERRMKRKEALDNYRSASEAFRLDFNERATGPNQFDEWMKSGEAGISEEETDYEGEKIKVYHLKGHEFLDLVHCIDYHGSYADKYILPEVYKRSRMIRDDPSNWTTMPLENNPKNNDNGFAKTDTSNNVSGSLVSDKLPSGYWGSDKEMIYYGFSNLGLHRVIKAGSGDMRVSQGWTSDIKDEDDIRLIETIDKIEESGVANEVAFDRYEEDSGRPILPDFIFCPNGTETIDDLTDAQKMHAAYFKIPIVILHKEAYKK